MTMTDNPAALSPNRRILMLTKEADTPVRRSSGMVPNPNETMVRKPPAGLRVLAAVTSMAQVKPHGRSPAQSPSPILDPRRREFARSRTVLAKAEPVGDRDHPEKNGKGKILRITRPSARSKIPETMTNPPRYNMVNLWTSMDSKTPAATAPRIPYVVIRPA